MTPLGTHRGSIIRTQHSLRVKRELKCEQMHLTSTFQLASPWDSWQHWPCGWPLSDKLTRLLFWTCNQGVSWGVGGGNERIHQPAEEGDWQPACEKSLNQQLEPCRASRG